MSLRGQCGPSICAGHTVTKADDYVSPQMAVSLGLHWEYAAQASAQGVHVKLTDPRMHEDCIFSYVDADQHFLKDIPGNSHDLSNNTAFLGERPSARRSLRKGGCFDTQDAGTRFGKSCRKPDLHVSFEDFEDGSGKSQCISEILNRRAKVPPTILVAGMSRTLLDTSAQCESRVRDLPAFVSNDFEDAASLDVDVCWVGVGHIRAIHLSSLWEHPCRLQRSFNHSSKPTGRKRLLSVWFRTGTIKRTCKLAVAHMREAA